VNNLSDWTIIGGLRNVADTRGLVSVPMVLRRGSELVITRRIAGIVPGPGGESLTESEWLELLDSGTASALNDSYPVRPYMKLWFISEEIQKWTDIDLGYRDAVISSETRDNIQMVLVDGCRTRGLRDCWATRAFDLAWYQARSGDLASCYTWAVMAFLLPSDFVARYLALMVLIDESTGHEERAQSYMNMASNSRGDDFRDDVRREVSHLSTALKGKTWP
jgi:hypothetical protein